MRSRVDLIAAATVAMALTAFIIWQSYEVRQSVQARFATRAMLLQVQVTGSSLVILNHDHAYFRDCQAVVNKTYRLGEPFLLPAPGVGEFVAPRLRISLADFKQGEQTLPWPLRSRVRLEISCQRFAEVSPTATAGTGSSAFGWEATPARWMGRL